jgi:hypothetical protein
MESRVAKQRTWAPTVAGILEIIEGAFSILGFLFLLIASIVVGTGSSWAGINESEFAPLAVGTVAAILAVIAVVVLAVAVLEVVGGIAALQRKNWGLALAGSIAAAIPGNILGILAIIFLAISKNEFD